MTLAAFNVCFKSTVQGVSAGKQGVLLAHSKDAGRYAEFATKSARKQGEVALVSSSLGNTKGALY